jgi:regulator of sigma E protease
MDWMISLAQLLLSLSILVAVHELGHLFAAKYFGMRVEQFSIGFPPKLLSFRKGETEYAISAIPLGGYVKISGMIDESMDTETMKQAPQPWEFRSKPAWQRLIVMLGGIVVNVVIGIFIFIGLTFVYGESYLKKDAVNNNGGIYAGEIGKEIGFKTGDKIIKINGADFKYLQDVTKPETLLSEGSYTVDRQGEIIDIKIPSNLIEKLGSKENVLNFISFRLEPIVGKVAPNTIAERQGLKVGDRIVAVNGDAIQYQDELREKLLTLKGKPFEFTISRDGNDIVLNDSLDNELPAIGFNISKELSYVNNAEDQVKYSFVESIPYGTERAFTTLSTQVSAFGKMISGKLNVQKSLSGPIGIMSAFGTEWEWERFWTLTGVLSLVLAFMNLLPIPALDGGHVMFLTYEIVSGRKPSDKFLENAQKVGMVILLALMVFVFANDILKAFGVV